MDVNVMAAGLSSSALTPEDLRPNGSTFGLG